MKLIKMATAYFYGCHYSVSINIFFRANAVRPYIIIRKIAICRGRRLDVPHKYNV